MSSLEGFEFIGLEVSEPEVGAFLLEYGKRNGKAKKEAVKERYALFMREPDNVQTLDSHPVGGPYGDKDWLLWRVVMETGPLRMFFIVNQKEKTIFIVELRNDHDYTILETVTRRGLRKLKKFVKAKEIAEKTVERLCGHSWANCRKVCTAQNH